MTKAQNTFVEGSFLEHREIFRRTRTQKQDAKLLEYLKLQREERSIVEIDHGVELYKEVMERFFCKRIRKALYKQALKEYKEDIRENPGV
jgi:hypothetical protein